MVSSAGFLVMGLLAGEETWSFVIGLWWFLEGKAGKGSLEERWREWWVKEEVAVVLVRRRAEAIRVLGIVRGGNGWWNWISQKGFVC